jgi:hypothetical protein
MCRIIQLSYSIIITKLAGDVVTCPVIVFKKILDSTTNIFLEKRHCPVVVIPPLPRYLFGGCCTLAEHCPNVAKPEHASKLLGDIIGLRNCLKKHVAGLGIANCRILDTCCVTDCIPTADTNTRLKALRTVTARDGIHFLEAGYDWLVRNILNSSEHPSSKAKQSIKAKQHYWRGFRSPVGTNTPGTNTQGVNSRGGHARNRSHRTLHFHPYKRK